MMSVMLRNAIIMASCVIETYGPRVYAARVEDTESELEGDGAIMLGD